MNSTDLHLLKIFVPVLGETGSLLIRHGRLAGLEQNWQVNLMKLTQNISTSTQSQSFENHDNFLYTNSEVFIDLRILFVYQNQVNIYFEIIHLMYFLLSYTKSK
jgi:hypothetical protein